MIDSWWQNIWFFDKTSEFYIINMKNKAIIWSYIHCNIDIKKNSVLNAVHLLLTSYYIINIHNNWYLFLASESDWLFRGYNMWNLHLFKRLICASDLMWLCLHWHAWTILKIFKSDIYLILSLTHMESPHV